MLRRITKRFLAALILLMPAYGHAQQEGGTGVWLGEGTIFTPDGRPIVSYDVEAVKTLLPSGELETCVVQTMADGTTQRDRQVQSTDADGAVHVRGKDLAFDVLALGANTAHCVILTPEGQRVIVTIVRHDALITVLQGGDVIALAKETLTRRQQSLSEAAGTGRSHDG